MGQIRKQSCFNYSGEDIYLFTLRNEKGTEVCISNYGAIITAFRIRQSNGEVNDIVLGFDKIEDYLSEQYTADYPYFGAAIGRYASRIRNGEFNINGTKYSLNRNNGANHLHGGTSGFDRKVWQVVSHMDAPRATLILHYRSPDGEEGYPGALDIELRFELTDEDELSYEYRARSEKTTPVNLTHHSYFNLDIQKGRIDEHLVRINAPAVLEQDNEAVVTGNLHAVDHTRYDFRRFRRIDADWHPEDGFDQSFILEDTGDSSPAAEGYSTQSGIGLQVFTTEPVIHFYTGKWIPELVGRKKTRYHPFSGFCFEAQVHPDAINHPHFPDTLLRPGETYHTRTTYRITQD